MEALAWMTPNNSLSAESHMERCRWTGHTYWAIPGARTYTTCQNIDRLLNLLKTRMFSNMSFRLRRKWYCKDSQKTHRKWKSTRTARLSTRATGWRRSTSCTSHSLKTILCKHTTTTTSALSQYIPSTAPVSPKKVCIQRRGHHSSRTWKRSTAKSQGTQASSSTTHKEQLAARTRGTTRASRSWSQQLRTPTKIKHMMKWRYKIQISTSQIIWTPKSKKRLRATSNRKIKMMLKQKNRRRRLRSRLAMKSKSEGDVWIWFYITISNQIFYNL